MSVLFGAAEADCSRKVADLRIQGLLYSTQVPLYIMECQRYTAHIQQCALLFVLNVCNDAACLPSWLVAGPAAVLSLGPAVAPSLLLPPGVSCTQKGGRSGRRQTE